ncbi:hypothetical protein PVAND_012519 [Polypedilum vanderplanki]|uniref:Anaphase-promoting complex subunit 1 n=1 Tax=Polypedilum vanderplanki TaxID=319348 RepID=A0A9J6CLW3_POLVA|nr:hypothetical protein PVAND_012519 [Polypedilum vanderplanki]
MIAAAEPKEYIPSGRKIVEEHCGPLNRRADTISSEFLLLDRMKNVNLSADEHFNESWTIRPVCDYRKTKDLNDELLFLEPHIVNSEEELYFSGHTAVWSSKVSETCYTTEDPIKSAFFCTRSFLDPDYNIQNIKSNKNEDNDSDAFKGIAIIDSSSMKVYTKSGEILVTAVESPINKVWITKYCVIFEKEASSSAIVDGHRLPMPRIFSLTHPLDDMFPVLLKSQSLINYITEEEFKIIFSTEESDLMLMFNSRNGKHMVCKLRKATEEETRSVTALYDTSNIAGGIGTHSSIGGFTSLHNSKTQKNNSGRYGSMGNLNVTHTNQSNNYRSSLASLADSFNRNSISMMARKIGECEPSKALVPDLILEQIWTENSSNWNEYQEMASKAFLHNDFVGQQFLCFLLPKCFKLQLLIIERLSSNDMPVFGGVSTIIAKDAVALQKMNMIIVLLPCGTLMIYSGLVAVGKIHVGGILTNIPSALSTPAFPKRSSILPNIASPLVDLKLSEEFHSLSPVHPLQPTNPLRLNNCMSLRDPVGNSLTISFTNGKMYRFELPQMCENPIVKKDLIALRQILPKDAMKILSRWYSIKNSPGARDLSLGREFEMFKNLLFEMIGRPHGVSHSSSSNAITDPKKRRKSENGSDSDWEYLISIKNGNCKFEDDDQEMIQNYHSDAVLFSNIPLIFYSLHLLYEDLKLDISMNNELNALSELLCQLAVDFKLENYRYHYVKDNPQLIYLKSKMEIAQYDSNKLQNKELINQPISIFYEISQLASKKEFKQYPYIPNINLQSKNVFEILAVIFERVKYPSEATIMIKISENYQVTMQNNMKPLSEPGSLHKIVIDTMIRKGITRVHLDRFPIAINYIICQILETVRLNPPIGCNSAAYKLLLRPELYTHAAYMKDDIIARSEKTLIEYDGMENTDTKLLRLRFPDDLRINDVKKFLNSSKPVRIDVVQSPNMSDHDFIEEQEKQLFALCTRTMALPIGRGMFTFRTYYPVLTEVLPIPKLCLTGKESVRGTTVELQQIEVPANMSVWPQFHNGVASALRIATDPQQIDPAYILYNKPKEAEMPPSYAGFLMALGLTSSLKSLSDTYLYDYLVRSEELLSVGLILGMAASYRETMNTKITRMLSVHIESLLPPTAIELDVPHNVQVASLLGIGLLYQKSNKRFIAEALLQEINRPPGPEMENYVERESYALSAGLALGMVCLETGSKDVGLDDLNLPDTLHYYMIGGTKRGLTGVQREKYKLPSFQIREGDQVNIDVTAPGSTLALGLMFFASGNEAVADWMKPPETMFLLDFVRPDLLLLRVIARGLIMWNTVEPTAEWINSQISKSLSKIIKQRPDPDNDDLDHEAICQAYCNIVTGAAMIIGLRYAGTENLIAFRTLKKIITFFLSANGQYIGEYAGKATVESCIVLVLIAASLVFAGTGNLQILRMIRMTRSRIGPQHSSVTYGSHMAIHMALGFLFLGAGRYTISRRPQAIAALICALFPKFPTHSNDNRYHLQALRHLYVLAVEPRLFLPRDIDNGKLVVCKLSYIEFNQKSMVETMAPCMLPELDSLKAVYINDPNYWPVVFERGRNWDQLTEILNGNGCIDIVQKAGCLSHLDDPNRLKSMLALTLTMEEYSNWKVEASNLTSFYNDQMMKSLTEMIMTQEKEKSPLREMILLQIYDCLMRDKTHALGIYISIDNIIQSLSHQKSIKSTDVWQLKILNILMHNRMHKECDSKSSLVSTEILNSLLMKIKSIINNRIEQQKYLLKKFLTQKSLDFLHQEACLPTIEQVLLFTNFFDLPFALFSSLNSENINLLQFIVEYKKRHSTTDTEFLSNLWKIVSS